MDKIEKEVLVRAPRAKVWAALTDVKRLSKWFHIDMHGDIKPGGMLRGEVVIEKFKGAKFEATVERVEPERALSWRWHPFAVEKGVDYSSEPTTLVEFTLSDAEGGTRLQLVESGFDKIPAARRAKAFEMNGGGWTEVTASIARDVGEQR